MLYTYRYHPVIMSFLQIGDSFNYFPGSQEHVTDEMTRDAAFELVDEAIELVIQCPAIHRESLGRVVIFMAKLRIPMDFMGNMGI